MHTVGARRNPVTDLRATNCNRLTDPKAVEQDGPQQITRSMRGNPGLPVRFRGCAARRILHCNSLLNYLAPNDKDTLMKNPNNTLVQVTVGDI